MKRCEHEFIMTQSAISPILLNENKNVIGNLAIIWEVKYCWKCGKNSIKTAKKTYFYKDSE